MSRILWGTGLAVGGKGEGRMTWRGVPGEGAARNGGGMGFDGSHWGHDQRLLYIEGKEETIAR